MEILELNSAFVVCVKPAGPDSEHAMPEMLSNAIGGPVWPVHRLDKNVGGVMVYARTKASAAALSRAVQDGTMVKEYVAWVRGLVPEEDTWQDYLWKDSSKNKVFVVKRLRKGVKEAKLSFKRLYGDTAQSLVWIRLHTGRSHQIRVQFASRKHPLIGDGKYGGKDSAIEDPRLFACHLSFPYDGMCHSFEFYPDWMI
ncbi:MAG: RNA pseudouridine synthase [Clostridia bacterium]|nr:RNA pseudouridine synthase [Clostridia bacterium]